MYCASCGYELPDSAKFCIECGTNQATGAESTSRQPVYEKCELVQVHDGKVYAFKNWRWAVEARVIGPKGQYTADTTGFLPVNGDLSGSTNGPARWGERDKRIWRPAVEELMNRLLSSGWEYVERQGPWFGHRFRREI